MRKSKRFQAIQKSVNPVQEYSLLDAIRLMKQNATAKFDETVELAANLGIDPRKSDQQVRGTVVLPKGTGKSMRVLVFAQGGDAEAAQAAGADVVGAEDLVEKIQQGFLDFDVALATPDMMRFVGRLGKILGPRGLMPNPKSGTVTREIAKAVSEFKGGKIEYRANKEGVVHARVGKSSFSEDNLAENVRAVIGAIVRARPAATKGTYIRSLYLTSTMGAGIRLDAAEATAGAREGA
jgi:large subunit ribosomal protein L1